MAITLKFRFEEGHQRTFNSSKREIVIGRPPGQTLPQRIDLDLTPDIRVSRPHTRLFYDLSTWWIEDLNSKHGTFRNGQRVTEAIPLLPGDELKLGDTLIQVNFFTAETVDESGSIEDEFIVSETEPPGSISPDEQLQILARVSEIGALYKDTQGKLDGFMHVLGDAFPRTEWRTLLLIEDHELVVRATWPLHQSFASFTLARKVIKYCKAIHWVPGVPILTEGGTPRSAEGTGEALYAPILSSGEVLGVVHIDSGSSSATLCRTDLDLLSVIANTMGPALKAGGLAGLPRLPSIFVSYSRQDLDFVKNLVADLRRRRIRVWLDERLQTGDAWRARIETVIRNTDATLVVLSPSSVVSQSIEWEITTARAAGMQILPVLYKPCDIPLAIASKQYITIDKHEQGIDNLRMRLFEMVQTDAEK